MRYTYDNSTHNVRNPNNPPKHIRWGLNSTDEMGEFYFQALARDQESYLTLAKDYSNYFLDVSIKHFVHLIEIEPGDARAHKRLGRALAAVGQVNEGISHLQKAIALQPAEDEPHYDLGSIYLRLGRLPDAFNEFREVVRLNPRDYQALGSLGILCLQAGKLEDGAEYFLQALRVNPDDPLAQKYLEMIRAQQKR
jgi:tetratricopeptide (TPR) repeat protein